MPLTNPNKIVTEERLSEFYGQILPYMGGMPDVLANKFSKGDLYSTDEKMIGQWTDGKPLYQKTISLTVPGSSGSVSTGISNGSNARIVSGYLETGGGNSWNALDGTLVVSLDASTITNGRNSDYSGRPAYATLQYTKTTDSAISIGSDTDYSTDEKIVGTWLNGEPLYQKYVEVPSKGTTWQNIYQQNGIDIKFCTFIQLYWNDANILWMPMAYYGSSSVSALYGIKGDAITASTIKSGSSYPIRMNIVYTKTS